MRNKYIVILSVVVFIIAAGLLYTYFNKTDAKSISSFIGEDAESEDPQDYSMDVPDEIENTSAWLEYVNSEYFDSSQEYVFRSTGDRIVSELYYNSYYVYIEYVFEEVVIDVYDSNTMEQIIRFQ